MDFPRRTFLVTVAGGVFAGRYVWGAPAAGRACVLKIGLVTDVHFADIDPDRRSLGVIGQRFYRESLRKLTEAVEVFNARRLDFAVELGDFKDFTRNRAETLAHLESIEAAFAKFKGPRYHLAGNHDFDCLTPADFFSRIPNDGRVCEKGYYSFVRGGVTFVALNACFDSQMRPYSENNPWDDANVPPEELAWLEGVLKAAPGNVFVFCHQRLDETAERRHLVRNAAAVRRIFEKSGKVKGVITGHQHMGGFAVVKGIPYYSLRALVCGSGAANNSFAEMAVYADGTFSILGWHNALPCAAEGERAGRLWETLPSAPEVDEARRLAGSPRCVSLSGEEEVWAAPLAGGDWALALRNLSARACEIEVSFAAFAEPMLVEARDCVKRADEGRFSNDYYATLPPKGAKVVRLKPILCAKCR